jgi:hypothetical protein
MMVSGPGYTAGLTSFSGHVDPEIVFGVGATNNSGVVKTFAFIFNLPLGGFPEPIVSSAQLGTTLTAPSDADASVFPVLGVGKIVDSQDINLTTFANVDKGVDIGDPLTAAAGTTEIRVENASGGINLGLGPYDLMTVTIAFGLTDNGTAASGVGFSGRVTQVPEPGTALLLGIGVLGLAWTRRRLQA